MHPRQRRGAVTGGLGIVGALLGGCFRDAGPEALCEGAACGPTTTSAGVTTSGEPPTTGGAENTTAAPVDPSITFRVDALAFIDPHLFLSMPAEGGTTDGMTTGGTTGDPGACSSDATTFVNLAIKNDVDGGKFNLMARFVDFGGVQELRLFDGDCEDPVEPGGRRVCTANPEVQAVLLTTQFLDNDKCSQLDPSQYALMNAPLINSPQAPCVRTLQVDFSLPVSDSVGALNLREAQFAARLDDPVAPQRLEEGVLYGFLPQAAAELLEIDAPVLGAVNLWASIDSPACEAMFPQYLPSVDMFTIGDEAVRGAWIAINFSAERVDFVSAP